MIDFITEYPLNYYLKTITNPKRNALKIGLYLSRDSSMMLLQDKLGPVYWNPNLLEINGAPSLDDTLTRNVDSNKAGGASAYRREIAREFKLNNSNDVSVIIEDPDTFTTTYTVNNFESAAELEDVLRNDPGSIITAWKNYNHASEYCWEIMTMGMHVLRGDVKLPKKVIITGFPESRVVHTAKWCMDQNQELINLVPVVPAIIRWCIKNGTEPTFFLLIANPNEIGICSIVNKEVTLLSTTKTRDGFTPDEIADVNELIEEQGNKKETIVWTWGLLPGSTAYARLASRYPNLKNVTAETLKAIKPLTTGKTDRPIAEKEAWLINNIIS
jgi:hypothetical protein